MNEKPVLEGKGCKMIWVKVKIEKGVRQGSNLSLTLFNVYIENALKKQIIRENDIGKKN